MARDRLRQHIAFEAARLMYEGRVSFHAAKFQAAQRITGGRVHPRDLPTHREIRTELAAFASRCEAADDRLLEPQRPDDRFLVYESLLAPLEEVKQSPRTHPEGDALYHSLQVFVLAREELPYDEELLLAALLHDVGKAIDARDHVAAGLEALGETITERTAWLIANHALAHELLDGTLGARARRRLEESEHFEELMLLARCDRAGRRIGVRVPELDEALGYVRELAAMCDE